VPFPNPARSVSSATREILSAQRGFRGRLPGCDLERLTMGPAVMPGQDLSEGTGPVRDGAVADLAAGDREMGNGHRGSDGKVTCSFDPMTPGPAGVIVHRAHAARTPRGMRVVLLRPLKLTPMVIT
jgi:hypothetical protein